MIIFRSNFLCSLGFHQWRLVRESESGYEKECRRCGVQFYGCPWSDGTFYVPVSKGVCHLCRGTGTVEDADGGPVPLWGNMVKCCHCNGTGKAE